MRVVSHPEADEELRAAAPWYSTTTDTIYIKAVEHLRRRPFYWKNRI